MINKFLASLPSTNFRIFATMLLVWATGARYLASGTAILGAHVDRWEPSEGWLLFLAAMAGIDLAQFHLKRKTFTESPPAAADVEDAKAGARAPAQDEAVG